MFGIQYFVISCSLQNLSISSGSTKFFQGTNDRVQKKRFQGSLEFSVVKGCILRTWYNVCSFSSQHICLSCKFFPHMLLSTIIFGGLISYILFCYLFFWQNPIRGKKISFLEYNKSIQIGNSKDFLLKTCIITSMLWQDLKFSKYNYF